MAEASRRTLTKKEFQQLRAILSLLDAGYGAVLWVSDWAPDGFGLVPGDGRVWCRPELLIRARATFDLINESKPRIRRALMRHVDWFEAFPEHITRPPPRVLSPA